VGKSGCWWGRGGGVSFWGFSLGIDGRGEEGRGGEKEERGGGGGKGSVGMEAGKEVRGKGNLRK